MSEGVPRKHRGRSKTQWSNPVLVLERALGTSIRANILVLWRMKQRLREGKGLLEVTQ